MLPTTMPWIANWRAIPPNAAPIAAITATMVPMWMAHHGIRSNAYSASLRVRTAIAELQRWATPYNTVNRGSGGPKSWRRVPRSWQFPQPPEVRLVDLAADLPGLEGVAQSRDPGVLGRRRFLPEARKRLVQVPEFLLLVRPRDRDARRGGVLGFALRRGRGFLDLLLRRALLHGRLLGRWSLLGLFRRLGGREQEPAREQEGQEERADGRRGDQPDDAPRIPGRDDEGH